jgi:hypothetical protein
MLLEGAAGMGRFWHSSHSWLGTVLESRIEQNMSPVVKRLVQRLEVWLKW